MPVAKAMNSRLLLLMFMMVICATSFNVLAEGLLNVSISYEYTTGDYGLERDTEITSLPLDIQYSEDSWRLSLSVPYIRVTGDGSVTPGINGVMGNSLTQNSQMGMGAGPIQSVGLALVETHSGLGDVITGVSYAFFPYPGEHMYYELTGEIKWGTASAEENLGTGENDYSISFYSIYEKHTLKPFLTLGYLFIGDTNAINYNDVVFLTPGIMYELNSDTVISFAYQYQQATTDSSEEGRMLNLYLGRKIDSRWTAGAYLLHGLSDSVAESGIGLVVSRYF